VREKQRLVEAEAFLEAYDIGVPHPAPLLLGCRSYFGSSAGVVDAAQAHRNGTVVSTYSICVVVVGFVHIIKITRARVVRAQLHAHTETR